MKRSRTRSNLVWLTLVAFSVQLAVAVLHHHVARGTGIASARHNGGPLCSVEPASVRSGPASLSTMTGACCAGQRLWLRRLWRRPRLSFRCRRKSSACASSFSKPCRRDVSTAKTSRPADPRPLLPKRCREVSPGLVPARLPRQRLPFMTATLDQRSPPRLACPVPCRACKRRAVQQP